MLRVPLPIRRCSAALLAMTLGGCSLFAPPPPPPPPPAPVVPTARLVASIRAAGEREKSIISVLPLQDPGITRAQETARRDEQAGQFAAAATALDQAIKRSPDSPNLLQDRAEVAVRLRDFATAERLARQSWQLGPKLGPLCARNWQTVLEMRQQAGDKAGAAAALQQVKACHKPGINRF